MWLMLKNLVYNIRIHFDKFRTVPLKLERDWRYKFRWQRRQTWVGPSQISNLNLLTAASMFVDQSNVLDDCCVLFVPFTCERNVSLVLQFCFLSESLKIFLKYFFALSFSTALNCRSVCYFFVICLLDLSFNLFRNSMSAWYFLACNPLFSFINSCSSELLVGVIFGCNIFICLLFLWISKTVGQCDICYY